jgi:X-X-X-Leu-X-X-Gly heptad repeat protein
MITMNRECPVCRTPLRQITIKQHLQIDVCLTCRGIWFDKNELTQTHAQGRLPETLMGFPDLTRDKVICQSCGAHNPRSKSTCERCGSALEFLCPACRIPLEEVLIGKVYIDRCKSCQGVWLDGGELTLLFEEFKQQKQQEVQRARHEGREITGDLAAWAALDALDLLIWRPDIAYRAGETLSDTIAELPGAVAGGAGAVLDGIGNIPEFAGDLAEGTGELASGAAEVAGDVIGGAIDLAGDLPEIAGNVAEVAGSFIEILFEILGSIFDN